MIEVRNLTKKFWKKEVLHDVSMKLDKGVYGLLGENGAGKTTLLRCLAGLYRINKGQILCNEADIRTIKNYPETIGYLPQKFEGISELTVSECLSYFAYLKNMKGKEKIDMEIDKVLDMVNLSENKNKKIKNLSGGMLRRVGIAQAVLKEPEMLLMDEPTVGLDPEERIRFKNMIGNYDKERIVIVSTHIVEDIEAICDKIIVMHKGNVLGVFRVEEIKNKAEKKVYEIATDQINEVDGTYKIIREYEKEGKIISRVLTSKQQNILSVRPTLEDGYLCMIFGI